MAQLLAQGQAAMSHAKSKPTKQEMYDLLSQLATLDEAGGLAKERSVLLLWFLLSGHLDFSRVGLHRSFGLRMMTGWL